MAPIKLLMDVDTGIDDAHAIGLALASKEEIEIIGISCVAGNGLVDTVVEATLKTLDAFEAPDDIPVIRGSSKPLVEEKHPCTFIHGADGLGDLDNPPLPKSTRRVVPGHACVWLLNYLENSESPISIVALGPLTNIAIAIRLGEEIMKSKIERIFWMGGAMRIGGNFAPWTEANAGYDPEAAHIVMTSGIPITMCPWDIYTFVDFSLNEVLALDPNLEGLSARLLKRDMENWQSQAAQIGDAITVSCVVDPSVVVKSDPYPVHIELSGTLTRGMTVVDQRGNVDPPDLPKRPPNATVIYQVDSQKIKKIFADRVLQRK